MANINDAFKIYKPQKKSLDPIYDETCIHCHSKHTYKMSQDGGSIRYCHNCSESFKAKRLYYGKDFIYELACGSCDSINVISLTESLESNLSCKDCGKTTKPRKIQLPKE